MKFVNLKTCDGIETYLHLDGGLLRLSELPEKLRSLSQREAVVVMTKLKTLESARILSARDCTAQNATRSTEAL